MNNNELKPRRWLLVVFIIIAIAIVVVLLNKLITDHNERKANGKGFFNFITEKTNNIDKTSFNSKFELRKGTQKNIGINYLLDDVITNNKTNSNNIIEVVYESIKTKDSEEIKNLKNQLSDKYKYEVTIDYDNNGYVNKITIEKKIDESTIKSFNYVYENRIGTNNGISTGWILDDIITNNKTNKEQIITVIYKDKSTSNPEEITNIKKSLEQWTNYELSIGYDEIGFVNKLTIED